MDISCLNRGSSGCGSGKCSGYANGKYAVCTMDKVITILNGYSATHRPDELRQLLLAGITGDKEVEEATHAIDTHLRLVEDPDRVSFGKTSFLLATKFEDTKKAMDTLGHPNFVYYRSIGLTFIDVPSAKHEDFITLFYWLQQLRLKKANANTRGLFTWGNREAFSMSSNGEKFITNGYGFFSSSVYKGMGMPRHRGYPITMSNNHKPTFQEKKVFDVYGYDPIQEKDEF